MSKIKIHISDNLKKVDHYNLLQSIMFFTSDVLEPYEHLFEECIFSINDDEDEDRQGCFFVVEEDIYFSINFKEVERAIKHKMVFKNFKKSLFFTILHEIGHGIVLLDKYLNKKSSINIESYFDIENEKTKKIMDKLKKEDLPKIEISRRIPEEIICDRFAYKNLSYFENLYNFEGILI